MSQTSVVGWHDLDQVVRLWEKIKKELREAIVYEIYRRNFSQSEMTEWEKIDREEILAWATDIVSEHEGPFVWAETLTDTIMKEMK